VVRADVEVSTVP